MVDGGVAIDSRQVSTSVFGMQYLTWRPVVEIDRFDAFCQI